jgi:hypothetical protein
MNGERSSRWRWRLAAGVLVTLLLPACGEPSETALKNAKAGDLLVKSGQTRVTLVAPFEPGVANGLYKGVIRVSQPGGTSRLYRMNGVCSMKNEPGWPTYDNLFGDPIADIKQASALGASPQRWQIFYHFDGRVEPNRRVNPEPWMARLKDNICRRGDFDDSARVGSAKS